MRRIVAAIRFMFFFGWVFLCEAIRLCFMPLAWWDKPRDRRWKRWWLQRWARGACRIAGIRVVAEGSPPQAPGLLFANHLSYLDILVMAQQTGYIFVAMSELAKWPMIGPICTSLDVIFMDRKDKSKAGEVLPKIMQALEQGDGVVIFPEGKITRGRDVAPFHSPVVEPARLWGKPVHCAAIHYASAPGAPPASSILQWWRPEPPHPHFLRMLQYPGATVTVRYATVDVSGLDRKQLALAMHDAVKQNFQPHP